MRRISGELQPAQAVALRMQALELEARRAQQHLRREQRAQGAGARWGLEQEAPHQQDEEWLITYLDMVTLLMVAMIMMLALAGPIGGHRDSTPHPLAAPAAALMHSRPAPALLPPIPAPEQAFPYPAAPPEAFMNAVTPAEAPAPVPATGEASPSGPLAAAAPAPELLGTLAAYPLPSDVHSRMADDARLAWQGRQRYAAAPESPPQAAAAPAPAPSEGEAVAASLPLGELGKDVEVIINKQSVSFRVNSEILFATGQADLSAEGLAVLKRMAEVLVHAGYDITVEGHTDSVRVRSSAPYPSNWELSSARAGSVVRYLQANGIPKSHLKAVGYADSRPIADNRTPEGRARNRRVELVVSKHHGE
jgi:chemotaxis protein MotB